MNMLVAAALPALASDTGRTPTPKPPATLDPGRFNQTPTPSRAYVSAGALIAGSREDLNTAVEVAASGDAEALNEMIAEGKIIIAEGPIQVFIVRAHAFEEWNPVEFRIKGKSKVFWTMENTTTGTECLMPKFRKAKTAL